MKRVRWFVVAATIAVAACATNDVPVDLGFNCPDQAPPLPMCVPGHYQDAIVSDAVGCGPDPRCGELEPDCGSRCSFPGLACMFFGVTVFCTCDGVAYYGPSPCGPAGCNSGPTPTSCPPDLSWTTDLSGLDALDVDAQAD